MDKIGNWFWTVLVLATLALFITLFAPDAMMGKGMIGLTVAVGWYFIIRDTLMVRSRNKQRQREYEERHGIDKEDT